ncbi:MAG: NADH-quinone oxidoreductase subunit C [Puniceicoccales bacterium]|jgi:NADH-quinone oxidoreductase subunit C|nr:NADH-quinone oxidoreductase subunit C [Puniceicoccales bacterium]
MKNQSLQDELCAQFPFLTPRIGGADATPAVNVPPAKLREFVAALRETEGFDTLADLAGCDWGVGISPRFSVIYHFQRSLTREYLRIACAASDDNTPTLPSLASLYPAANWLEREAADLFGFCFDGHPDPRPLLLWEGFQGHPLRKDFPLAGTDTTSSPF